MVTGLLLSATLINDITALLAFEMPEHTTQSFTLSVLVSQNGSGKCINVDK